MPTDKLTRAVIAYDRGPYQGDWEQACREAGFVRVPSLRQKRVQEAFTLQGLPVPLPLEETPSQLAAFVSKPMPTPLTTPDDVPVFEAPELPDASASEQEWDEYYAEVDHLWYQIGMGTVACSSAQRHVLQEMRTRRHGKAGVKEVKENTDGLHHIVVLPALGSGMGATICPICKERLVT